MMPDVSAYTQALHGDREALAHVVLRDLAHLLLTLKASAPPPIAHDVQLTALRALTLSRAFKARRCDLCRHDTDAPACGAGWHRPALTPEWKSQHGCTDWDVKDRPDHG